MWVPMRAASTHNQPPFWREAVDAVRSDGELEEMEGRMKLTLGVLGVFAAAAMACSPAPPSNPNCGTDTTAPKLSVTGPSCMWSPNHKMGLYTVDNLTVSVQDDCDANPIVKIVSVSSNQPDLGGGQGDFTPDVLHGNNAACFRAERQGTDVGDREYSIVVTATDASNNVTTQTLVVRVPHEGTCGDEAMPPMVDDNDPRCAQ